MKRAAVMAASAACTLAMLATVVVVWRAPLLERALTAGLAAAGFENPRLSVRAFGPRHIVLAGLQFGKDGAVAIDRATADFTLPGLFDGRVGSLRLTGVRIRGTLGADGLRVPGVILSDGGGATGRPPPFDLLKLEDASLALETPLGPLALQFGGSLASQGGRLDALIKVNDGTITAVDAELRGLEGEVHLRLDSGRIPTGAGAVRLTTREMHIAVTGETLTGRARLAAELDGYRARIKATFETPHGILAATLPLELVSKNGLQASGTLDATAVDVALAGIESARTSLIAPLRIQNRPDGITIALAAPAQFTTGAVIVDGGFRMALTQGAILETGGRPLFETAAGGWRTSFRLNVPTLDVANDGKQISTRNLALEWLSETDATGASAGGGTFSFDEARLDGPVFVLADGRAEIAVGRAKPAIVRLAATLTHDGETPLFAPLDLKGIVETVRGFRIKAGLTDTTGTERIAVAGIWPLDTAKDTLTIQLLPLAFTPGSLQPGTLSARLDRLENVSGRASGMLRIHGGARGPEAGGDLRLSDLSFALAGLAVDGLNGDLSFTRLMPPTTPPDQVLTVRRVELGIALDNVRVLFRLTAGAGHGGDGALVVSHATAETLGGTISLAPATFALTALRHTATLRLHGLQLERVLALFGVDGVSGTGALSGTVPLTIGIADGNIAINNARLGSLGGGTLKVRSERAAELLQGQGEQIDMAIRALEDFRYDTLTLELEKPAAGQARARLRLYGHSPAVLDGQPFHFNVNVQSDVNQLIEALLKGSALAAERLRPDGAGTRP